LKSCRRKEDSLTLGELPPLHGQTCKVGHYAWESMVELQKAGTDMLPARGGTQDWQTNVKKKKKQKAGTNMPYLTYSPPGLHRGLFSTPPTTFYCWGLSDPCPPQLGWSVPSLLLSNCPPPCHVLQACLYLSFLVVWHGVCAIPAQSQWCGFVGGVLVVAVGCFVFKVSPHFLGSSRGSRTVASAHVLRTIFLVCCFCCLSVLCLVMVSLQTTV